MSTKNARSLRMSPFVVAFSVELSPRPKCTAPSLFVVTIYTSFKNTVVMRSVTRTFQSTVHLASGRRSFFLFYPITSYPMEFHSVSLILASILETRLSLENVVVWPKLWTSMFWRWSTSPAARRRLRSFKLDERAGWRTEPILLAQSLLLSTILINVAVINSIISIQQVVCLLIAVETSLTITETRRQVAGSFFEILMTSHGFLRHYDFSSCIGDQVGFGCARPESHGGVQTTGSGHQQRGKVSLRFLKAFLPRRRCKLSVWECRVLPNMVKGSSRRY